MENKMKKIILGLFASITSFAGIQNTYAVEPFIGEIRYVGFNFCPRGWASADGQLLAINQYQALFSLYGTMYGGDGRTSFGLPDLRGRNAINAGQGPGLSNYSVGQKGGEETVTLTNNNLPNHTHKISTKGDGSKPKPGIKATQNSGKGKKITTKPTGGSQPHNNMAPFLAVKACVAVQGIYPSRN